MEKPGKKGKAGEESKRSPLRYLDGSWSGGRLPEPDYRREECYQICFGTSVHFVCFTKSIGGLPEKCPSFCVTGLDRQGMEPSILIDTEDKSA